VESEKKVGWLVCALVLLSSNSFGSALCSHNNYIYKKKVQDVLKSLGDEKEAKVALESSRKEISEDLRKAKLEEKRLNDQVYISLYCTESNSSSDFLFIDVCFHLFFFSLCIP
jgi:hypothetical protein